MSRKTSEGKTATLAKLSPLESKVVRQIFDDFSPLQPLEKRGKTFFKLVSLFLFSKDDAFCALLLEEIKLKTNELITIALNGLRILINQETLDSYTSLDLFMQEQIGQSIEVCQQEIVVPNEAGRRFPNIWRFNQPRR